MRLNLLALTALTLVIAISQVTLAQSKHIRLPLTLREEVMGYNSELEAKQACIDRASLYLKKYEDVVCEPVLKTNIRTLHWNTIVSDSVYSGSVSNVHKSSSHYSDSGSSSFVGEIVAWGGKVLASLNSSYSSSGSSSSYSRTETPVYSSIYKSIPQYRDEVVETYGYRVITSIQESIVNTDGPDDIIFKSNKSFASPVHATNECLEYAARMSGFRVIGKCEVTQDEKGSSSWTFSGKYYFQK